MKETMKEARTTSVQLSIEQALLLLEPMHLLVENESHRHRVPENSQTHFKITLISEKFDGQRLLMRHRMINDLLKEQLAGQVHALSLHLFTPKEWSDKGGRIAASPLCMGKNKQ